MNKLMDTSEVDEMAVEFACDGYPMKLNRASQLEAIKRMHGKKTVGEIARLIGAPNEKWVHRMVKGQW